MVVAVGNQESDLFMFAIGGLGVAMATAQQVVGKTSGCSGSRYALHISIAN